MLKITEYKLFSSDDMILTIEDLAFEQSSFSYIQGPNSTGKSLFLQSLNGQYKKFTGHLYFKKQKLSAIQNNIMLITTDLPVLKKLSFLENIQISIGKLGSIQKNKLMDIASMFDIADKLNIKMEYSSRSEKMFMYLIRAALICPNILLIDDLDNFFDIETFRKVYQIIPFCLKSGMLIISTGKSHVENIPSYIIKSGALHKK